MTREEILPEIRQKLGAKILDVVQKSPKRIYIDVRPEDIPEVSRYIFKDLQARLQIATGMDTPQAIEVMYHWAFDSLFCVVTVRTKLDRNHPEVESIAPFCAGADWIEREMWEMLGINFKNHPDLRHLLLVDDWPAGNYPLRRDWHGLEKESK
jgi:Ni,Fe-hydrogenase III component G